MTGPVPSAAVPREVLERDDVREALADQDIGQVFFLVRKWAGISYSKIAESTGIKPQRVGSLARGRASVTSYAKLAAIADGLRIPGRLIGLAPRWWEADLPSTPGSATPGSATPGSATPGSATGPASTGAAAADAASGSRLDLATHLSEMDEATQVRLLLTLSAEVTMGLEGGIDGPEWGWVPDEATPVPQRVGGNDVDQIVRVTAEFRSMDRRYGGGACRDAVLAQTLWVTRLLDVETSDEVRQRLHLALADLFNLGGWTSMDLGLYPAARRHFAHAATHARRAQAPSLLANVLYRTGRLHLHRSLTDAALRFFQLGQIAAQDAGDARTVAALCANEAWAYAVLGDRNQAIRSLQRAGDELARAESATDTPWVEFFGATELRALTGMTYLELSAAPEDPSRQADLDQAMASLRDTVSTRGADTARSRAFDLTALATLTLRAGDRNDGIELGQQAVGLAEQLRSVRVVDRLAPLAAEASQVDTADARDLAADIARLASA